MTSGTLVELVPPPARRTYRILCGLFAVGGVQVSVLTVFLPFVLLAMPGGDPAMVALCFALQSLGTFFGGHLWGPWIDQATGIRPFLLVGAGAGAVMLWAMASAPSAWLLVAMASATTVLEAGIRSAGQTWVTLRFPRAAVGRALGWLFTWESLGWGCACVGAGFYVDRLQAADVDSCRGLLQGFALLYVAMLPLVWWCGDDRLLATPAAPARHTGLAGLVGELRQLYGRADLLWLGGTVLVISASANVYYSMFSTCFCNHLGGSKTLMGASLACSGFLGAWAYVWMGRLCDRFGRWTLLKGAALGYVAVFACIMCTRSPLLVALVYTLPVYPALRVASVAAITFLTAREQRGGAIGMLEGLMAFSGFAGPLLAGLTVRRFGYEGLAPVAALVGLVGVALSFALAARLGGRPTLEPEGPVPDPAAG